MATAGASLLACSDGGDTSSAPAPPPQGPPAANAPPTLDTPARVSVAENETATFTIMASDADGDQVSLSLAGADAALFTIDQDGTVRARRPFDFERSASASGDNEYLVEVIASDGEAETRQAVTVDVTDEAEAFIDRGVIVLTDGSEPEAFGTEFGAAVATISDLDGDGLDELAVSAPATDTQAANSNGVVYVVSGARLASEALGVLDVSAAGPGIARIEGVPSTFQGRPVGERLGGALTTLSDLNGDGVTELVVASTFTRREEVRNSVGSALVVSGSAIATALADGDTVDLSAPGASLRLLGTEGSRTGVSVTSVPDLNADRLPELAVCAPSADRDGNENAGAAYVVFGDALRSGLAAGDIIDLEAMTRTGRGVVVRGSDSGVKACGDALGMVDLDGDQIADLVTGIGSYALALSGGALRDARDEGGVIDVTEARDRGDALLVVGGVDQPPQDYRFEFVGTVVRGAGDVNADGFTDLLVTDLFADVDFTSLGLGDFSGAGWTSTIFGEADFFGTPNRVIELGELDENGGGFEAAGTADFATVGASAAVRTDEDGAAETFFLGSAQGTYVMTRAFFSGFAFMPARPIEASSRLPLITDPNARPAVVGDLDTDGVPDLLLATPERPVQGGEVGTVILLSAGRLTDLADEDGRINVSPFLPSYE